MEERGRHLVPLFVCMDSNFWFSDDALCRNLRRDDEA